MVCLRKIRAIVKSAEVICLLLNVWESILGFSELTTGLSINLCLNNLYTLFYINKIIDLRIHVIIHLLNISREFEDLLVMTFNHFFLNFNELLHCFESDYDVISNEITYLLDFSMEVIILWLAFVQIVDLILHLIHLVQGQFNRLAG